MDSSHSGQLLGPDWQLNSSPLLYHMANYLDHSSSFFYFSELYGGQFSPNSVSKKQHFKDCTWKSVTCTSSRKGICSRKFLLPAAILYEWLSSLPGNLGLLTYGHIGEKHSTLGRVKSLRVQVTVRYLHP